MWLDVSAKVRTRRCDVFEIDFFFRNRLQTKMERDFIVTAVYSHSCLKISLQRHGRSLKLHELNP